jgi:hypothetical protein
MRSGCPIADVRAILLNTGKGSLNNMTVLVALLE